MYLENLNEEDNDGVFNTFIHKERDIDTGKLQFIIIVEEVNILYFSENLISDKTKPPQKQLAFIGGTSYSLSFEVWPPFPYPNVIEWIKQNSKYYYEPEIEIQAFDKIKFEELANLIKTQKDVEHFFFPDFMLEGFGIFTEIDFEKIYERMEGKPLYGIGDYLETFFKTGITIIENLHPWVQSMIRGLDMSEYKHPFKTNEFLTKVKNVPPDIATFLIDNEANFISYCYDQNDENENEKTILLWDIYDELSHVVIFLNEIV